MIFKDGKDQIFQLHLMKWREEQMNPKKCTAKQVLIWVSKNCSWRHTMTDHNPDIHLCKGKYKQLQIHSVFL